MSGLGPLRAGGYVGFSHEMEHQIIAGADILIMPSRYEPCGLPQVAACTCARLCALACNDSMYALQRMHLH
jgi:hypothetical protein